MKRISTESLVVFLSTTNLLLLLVGYQFIATLGAGIIAESTSRALTVPFRALCVALSLLVLFLNIVRLQRMDKYHVLLFVFWGLLMLRFWYDLNFNPQTLSISSDAIRKTWFFMGLLTVLPALSIIVSHNHIDYERLFFWAYCLLSVSIVFLFLTNVDYQIANDERLEASQAMDTISSGHMGLTALILSLYIIRNKQFSKVFKIVALLVGFLSLLIMLRSGSRGPLLCLVVVILVWILSYSRNVFQVILITSLSILFVYVISDFIVEQIGNISPVLYGRLTQEDVTFSGRTQMFNRAWNGFLQSPLWGSAFAHYQDHTIMYTHNVFLDSLMQLGIVGGGLVLTLYIGSINRVRLLIKNRQSFYWLGLILIQYMTKILSSGSIYTEPIVSILIALIFCQHNKKS